MSTKLLLSSDVLDMHHDEKNAWLYLGWKGPQQVELVQGACQQLTEFLRQTGTHKALNDNTHITQTSWELVKWVADDYLPGAGRLGLDYVAWAQSPLPSCRSNPDLTDDFVERKPQVAIFQDMAAACEWLGTVSVPVHH